MNGLGLAVVLFFTLNLAALIVVLCAFVVSKENRKETKEAQRDYDLQSAIAKLRII